MAKQYIEPEKRYEDQKSTGIVFTFMGALGMLVSILCILNILNLPFGSFQKFVLLFMFAACLCFGIGSLVFASRISKTISAENDQVAQMRLWIARNRQSFCTASSCNIPENEAYFQREQEIRSAIMEQFPEIEEGLLDLLTEETYQALFETA